MNRSRHQRILFECLGFLAANKIAVTQGISAVIEYFFSNDNHSTVEEIERHARISGLSVSHDEIRKTMKLLVEYGFAAEKTFGDGKTRFEHLHVGEHHDHLYCGNCGKIVEFTCPTIEEQQIEVARRHGFHPLSHKMQIQGLCAECFGQATSNIIALSQVEPGARFRVVETGPASRWGAFGLRRRVHDLGIAPGLEAEVLSRGPGLMVVLARGARIALRRGQCAKINVVLVPGLDPTEGNAPVQSIRILSSCREGQGVTINKIRGSGPFRKRLLEMGFTKGTPVSIVRYAPLRDPMELEIKGCRVSLRVCEADRVEVN